MGRTRAVARAGLTLRDHQYLSTEIGALLAAAYEARDMIRDGEGSGTPAHQGIGRVVQALRGLRDILKQDLRDLHRDGAEIQQLYEEGR